MPKVTKAKKQWYQLIAPEMFRGKSLGEVILLEPESFLGKIFSVNLMNVISDARKQNINMFFEASGVKDGKINTKVSGYEMMPSSVKRMVRRGKNKLDMSFVCRTSDGVHVRIKPIIITFSDANSTVRRALGKKVIEEITKRVRKTSFDNLIGNLINRRMQQGWYEVCKKVYPIKIIDIRSIKVEKSKRGLKHVIEVPEEKEVPGEKKEVKEEVKEEKAEAEKPEIKKPSKATEKGLEKTESSQKEEKAEVKAEKPEAKPEEKKEAPKEEVKEAPKVEPKTEVKEKAAVEG